MTSRTARRWADGTAAVECAEADDVEEDVREQCGAASDAGCTESDDVGSGAAEFGDTAAVECYDERARSWFRPAVRLWIRRARRDRSQ